MDVIKIMEEFLGEEMDKEEMKQLAVDSITAHLQLLKKAIANTIISARSATLVDNLEGSDHAMAEARKFQKLYYHFQAELSRLHGIGPESTNNGIINAVNTSEGVRS